MGKRFFLTDRHAYRQWLEALADAITDLQVISVAHGSPIVTDCNYRLREAAARLLYKFCCYLNYQNFILCVYLLLPK